MFSKLNGFTVGKQRLSRCFSTLSYTPPVMGSIDIHTHVYLDSYVQLLRDHGRTQKVPYLTKENELVLFPEEKQGRLIGSEYWDLNRKLNFMNTHNISKSFISLANPWLDFLEPDKSLEMARKLNNELQDKYCNASISNDRIYGFGVLPFTSGIEACINEVKHIKNNLPSIKGVIMGTNGIGTHDGLGLADERLIDLYHAINDNNLIIFIHPHYGIGNEYYEGYGHSLKLGIGFPLETTIRISQLIFSGIIDKILMHNNNKLKLLLAHSGGVLPYLSGRLDSCYKHEKHIRNMDKLPSDYLKDFYYDSICYEKHSLQCAIDLVSDDNILFGTDHPFFPPPQVEYKDDTSIDEIEWISTSKNQQVLSEFNQNIQQKIYADNALKLFNMQQKHL